MVQLAKQWMEESDSLYLKATGALFIANMARSGWLRMICAANCGHASCLFNRVVGFVTWLLIVADANSIVNVNFRTVQFA